MPGIIVISAAIFCGGKNLIQRSSKSKENFLFGSETGFFGGADNLNNIVEENNYLESSASLSGNFNENVLKIASVKQPMTIYAAEEEISGEFNVSDIAAMPNPNNPNYMDNSDGLREEIIKYTVLPGDTISAIAEKFGISTNTVLWANGLTPAAIIKPGEHLDILPITGVRHKVKAGDTVENIAKKYNASPEEIEFFNGTSSDKDLKIASIVIVPGGILPQAMRPKSDPAKMVLKSAPVITKAKQSSGYFIYPATGHNWGRIHAHNGVDISNPKGGPIYAAASGTVILADSIGYNGGYGKYIKIKHPNGVITLYAHLSKIYVSNGQTVEQGAVIGMMGSTGHSTGTHLHFEVRGAKNPLARY